jgi:hypothetical protein
LSIFLSYSSTDRPFAQRVCEQLAQYFEVFFDTRSIPGGAEWEREIDRAIRACQVFIPIVSTAANNSTWVARETLLALSVGVPILPILWSDSPPLRIVDRQFVDFRESFEAGLSDLLAALAAYLGPVRPSRETVDSLIARAIRARLSGKIHEANALVEQFVGPESGLAENGQSFWRKLETALASNFAETVAPRLTIREVTSRANSSQYQDRVAFEWALEIHGADECLDFIEAVVYTLHPTFENRTQKVRSREDHFRLKRVGWGIFPVEIRVEFIDYTAFEGRYTLTFQKTHEARLVRSQ